ncbi:MAG: 2-C-methyl-D-erythritol 2,4-cyclodiphosphate synthase [Firmicutes bacterium]|nr:2-C-methyl-D-erythritol 2,4-cyclodiphosphate synthase [Bacillota bacterium]
MSRQKAKNLSICALIVCAGKGTRAGMHYNKLLYQVGKKSILEMTIDRFQRSLVGSIVLVINPMDETEIQRIVNLYSNVSYCFGGSSRTESVRRGLSELGFCDIVVIHDGARPYVKTETIDESVLSAIEFGSGVTAVPTVDTIKFIKTNKVIRTLSRSGLYNIQTPQAFDFAKLQDAYDKVKGNFTDDSEVFEKAGYSAHIIGGEPSNIKVTHASDLFVPAVSNVRVGVGYDVHRLVPNRRLFLGGVLIPYDKGLLGHSDADVVLHAIMDAILSAASMPDIGQLFSDKDPRNKDISSLYLLKQVHQLITQKQCKISNISSVIIAQAPLLAPFVDKMRQTIASTLEIMPEQVSISCTTTEGLGVVGEGQAIASNASCTMIVDSNLTSKHGKR